MLFVFAGQVLASISIKSTKSAMNALFGLTDQMANLPERPEPLDHPRLDWREARDTGRALLAEQACQHSFAIKW